MISVASTLAMILSVFTCVFLITKVSKIGIRDLGLAFKGAFPKVLLGTLTGFAAISIVAGATYFLG